MTPLQLLLQNPAAGAALVLGLIISLSLHEWSHAFVATKLGDNTAEREGRLTLNPLAHLDPLGAVAILLIGFGWGKPVPYDPRNLKRPADELWVAVAGPAMNLLVAFVIGLAFRFLPAAVPAASFSIFQILAMMGYLNLILAVFNLLPVPPLDGSKFVLIFLSPIQRLIYLQQGQMVLLAIIVIDVVTGAGLLFRVMQPFIVLFGRLTGVPIG